MDLSIFIMEMAESPFCRKLKRRGNEKRIYSCIFGKNSFFEDGRKRPGTVGSEIPTVYTKKTLVPGSFQNFLTRRETP